MEKQQRFMLGDNLVGQGTANCATLVPKQFDDKFQWLDDTYPMPGWGDKLDADKKRLRKQGWTVRTHYYPGLGAYALKAIKAKVLVDEAIKAEMVGWVKF